MKDFVFNMPTKVVFAVGAVNGIGQECRALGGTKAFLVTGRTATRNSPYLGQIEKSLQEAGVAVQIYAEIEADPSVGTIDRGAAVLKSAGADIVIAFGGGSPIDAAKAMAMLQKNEGSILDYMRGRRQTANAGLPLICIPTTAGSGSEVTAAAVVTDRGSKEKIGISHGSMTPKVAIVDPVLHVSMPPAVTASTGIDALTHAIEAYTAVQANPLSDAACLQAIRLIGKYLRRAVANGKDMEARGNMALASLLAGIGFNHAGLGAVHGIAHPIGAQFGVAHGVGNGIMLPYVMEYCAMADYTKFGDIAAALGENISGMSGRDAAQQAVSAVRALKQDIGIPETLAAAGVPPTAVDAIVRDAITYRRLPNSPRQLTGEDLTVIVERALGIKKV
ncbi:alcohol dehydrogenase iron-type [Lucifera butyrica]|uniref:Alcohol dehydrogenase iron-type n=1 Tax=Lucifera butyrica TaxID=1351585 RepID=A0A498R3M4_9FIRM|nr:iron-containing alcohol dehydrogenase [Lucifera butyrica]VBB05745.1 alcohol dehydrogenase iron-type [Lucifera butyrica]